MRSGLQRLRQVCLRLRSLKTVTSLKIIKIPWNRVYRPRAPFLQSRLLTILTLSLPAPLRSSFLRTFSRRSSEILRTHSLILLHAILKRMLNYIRFLEFSFNSIKSHLYVCIQQMLMIFPVISWILICNIDLSLILLLITIWTRSHPYSICIDISRRELCQLTWLVEQA